jgi:hypothetical protein
VSGQVWLLNAAQHSMRACGVHSRQACRAKFVLQGPTMVRQHSETDSLRATLCYRILARSASRCLHQLRLS